MGIVVIGIIFLSLFLMFIYEMLKGRRVSTEIDFFFGRKEFSWFSIALSLAASFIGAASFISISGLAYKVGFWALVDPISVFLGCVIALFLVRVYLKTDIHSFGTIGTKNFLPLRLLIGLVSALVYVLFSAAQIVAIKKLLVGLGLSLHIADVVTAIVFLLILLYLLLHGISGVVRTDVIQFLFLFVSFLIIYATLVVKLGFPVLELKNAHSFNTIDSTTFALLSLSIFFVPISYTVFSRAKLAKDIYEAKKGILVGGIIYFFVLTIIITFGILGRLMFKNLPDSEVVLFSIINTMPSFFKVVGYIVLSMAIYSSLDSFLFNAALAFKKDVMDIFVKKNSYNLKSIATLMVAFLSFVISISFPSVLGLILLALYLYVAILFPMVLSKLFFPVGEKVQFYSCLFIFFLAIILNYCSLNGGSIVYSLVFGHLFLLLFAFFLLKFLGREK